MLTHFADTVSSSGFCLADIFDNFDSGDLKTIAVIGIGAAIAIIAILASLIKTVATTKAREATKREIAAYVAEGSIKPEDAVAMLNAGKTKDGSCC